MAQPSERRQDRFLREDNAGTQEPAHVALLKSEERFRLLVEAVHDYALIMLDAQGHILCWNKGAERLSGYEATDMLSTHFSALYRQDAQHGCPLEQLLQAAARHGAWEGRLWQKRKDQEEFLAHITMRAIKDNDGHVMAFSHVTHDITTQKHHEDMLRDQAQQFRVMTEALPGIVFSAHPHGGCDYLNATFYAYTGMATGSGEGAAWQTAVHPHDHDAFRQAWTTARNRGHRFEQMVRLRRADQTFRWFLVHVCPIRDGGGRLRQWIGACTDVHDLRITEEALRLAQTETHAGVWSWDLANNRMSWSPEYYDLCGLDPSVVPSYENWLASIVEDDRTMADSSVRKAVDEGTDVSLQFAIHHPTRGRRCLLAVGRITSDAKHQAMSMAGITLDITPQKHAEEEVHRLNVNLNDRVNELQAKIQELEAFHDVVVGRELKMMALEKANAALEQELQVLKKGG